MRARLLLGVPFVAGCLEIGETTYRFDLAAGTGTLLLTDVRTDTATDADKDFGELVNSYVLGNKVSEDHPAWNVGERRLFEAEGALSGEVQFTFGRAADVGLYQYDKKSPYLWCAADTETVIRTTGEIVGPYPKCVVFDRKTKVFEVTVKTGSSESSGTSLLAQFQGWDGKEIAGSDDAGALAGMMGLLGALGSMAEGGGDSGAGALGEMLAGLAGGAATLGESWAAMKLPVEGGSIVLSTEQMLEVSFPSGDPTSRSAAFEKALTAEGWKRASEEAGAIRFEKGGDALRLSAVKAGDTVLVVLSR